MPEKELKKYSYIKKPFAKNGWYAFFTTLMVVVLSILDIYLSVRNLGTSTMLAGALGISCMLFAAMGIVFAAMGLREPEKDQIFSYLSMAVDILILLFWCGITALGLM